MTQFFLFMIFWTLGLVIILMSLYWWYTHWKAKSKKNQEESQNSGPKPKLIEFRKMD